MRTVAQAGVEVCFANPGTTEMHFVEALDDVGGIRPVLGLFEGVCSGAADGYARMSGRPALTLLHLGPGLANAIANLHNAARARTPLLAVVGDHTRTHRGRGAPLETDIEGLARPVSAWLRTSASSGEVASDAAEALAAATAAPGGVATLVVPADCSWDEAPGPVEAREPAPPARVDATAVEAARGALRGGRAGALLLGGPALGERGLRAAGRVAAATGCLLFAETFPARMERGGDLPAPMPVPYFPEEATAALARASALVLAGAPAPVAFFGYPDQPSDLAPPGLSVVSLAQVGEDAVDALERLADELGDATGGREAPAPAAEPPAAVGPLTPQTVAPLIAARQPEGAIVVDEGITVSRFYVPASMRAPRHTYLALTGGAIGQGLPCATGAAIACPDRPVLALQADGSAMYTLQALWTQAREGLEVTTLICANRGYEILVEELRRAGVAPPGRHARTLTALDQPPLDWPALAAGMGVPARRAATAEELAGALDEALREPGPHLVEMLLS
jgi:acetolactate synthase I/II/III large subunit